MKKLLFSTTVLMFINALTFGQLDDSLLFRHTDILYEDTIKLMMVGYIPYESKVKVIEYGEKYYKVRCKNYTGWALKSMLVTEADYKAEKLAEKRAIEKAKQDRVNRDFQE